MIEKWPRYIMHADLNHCYAQIEEMLNPSLRNIPMAVGGDEDKRHGIILAKNDLAKPYGIKTGESLREAYKRCPRLYIVKPQYDLYIYYTNEVKKIYKEYSDRVESFGLDEAWIDISDSLRLFGDPISLARTIQKRVYDELGLTISIGLSYNKIFAKLGSDMDKKMGFTIISPTNYKEMIFDLKVEELLYVGRATKEKLNIRGIYTIGDLARCDPDYLKRILGKNGLMIWYFANGLELGDVNLEYYKREVKSVGNGVTAIRDLKNFDDLKMVFYVLASSVASRLKDIKKEGKVISIGLRDKNLAYITRQKKLFKATNLEDEILNVAMFLARDNIPLDECGNFKMYYRSISISVSALENEKSYIEYDLFDNEIKREKEKNLEKAIDLIREKYGYKKITRLLTKFDEDLTDFNPKGDHIIHPESWY